MATAMRNPAYSMDIKLEYGVPQTFALKFIQGKSVESRFPGGRCMFTAVDDRKLFLNDEDALDLQHSLTRLQIRPAADFIKVTKIKHPHGGGHSLRVERAEAESDLEQKLEQSVAMARRGEPFRRPEPPPAPPVQQPAPAAERAPGGLAKVLAGALCASIDGYQIAAAYAESKGVEFHFDMVDIRSSASTLMIEYFKREGGRP